LKKNKRSIMNSNQEEITCPYCESSHIEMRGVRNNRQKYHCKACDRWFSIPLEDLNKAMDEQGNEDELVKNYFNSKEANNISAEDFVENNKKLAEKLFNRFTVDELKKIANGKYIEPKQLERPALNFDGDEITVGFMTDPHIGSIFFEDFLWDSFLMECEKQKVNCVCCAGDVTEGMSNRPDQIYELTDIGYSAQIEHAQRLLVKCQFPIFAVDGNHDRWGIKSGGIFVVKEIAKLVPQMTLLGHDVASVMLNDTKWTLWHGEDTSSYAVSYRIQKIIESINGGDKPSVLLLGHTHKQAYIFDRNIHAVSGGALSYQSSWMRAKRIACHTGFHILKAKTHNGEVVSFTVTWYPFYK